MTSQTRSRYGLMHAFAIAMTAAIVVAGSMWARGNGQPSGSARAQAISIQELHALVHLDALPIQHFGDQSLVYPALAR